MHILVVDDDPLAGEMTAALLESQGHTCLLANDAMEAISHLDSRTDIAVIVSDMHMPLISGLELFEMLREQQVTLPFIMLTGDTSSPEIQNVHGLSACLQKDAELEHALARAVEQAMAS